MNQSITKLLLLLLFVLPLGVNAQIQKGDQLLTFAGFSDIFTGQFTQFPIRGDIGRAIFVLEEGSNSASTFTTEYSFALTNRFLLGGVVGFANFDDDTGLSIGPKLRYYVKNSENLQLYGSFTAVFGDNLNDDLGEVETAFEPAIGGSVPIANNVLFAPQLAYRIYSGGRTNELVLQTQVDFLIGPNRISGGTVVPEFGKKTVRLGVGTNGLSIRARGGNFSLNSSLSPSLYYFVGEKNALGFHFNRDQTLISPEVGDDITLSSVTLTLNFRHYLKRNNRVTPFADLGAGAAVLLSTIGDASTNSDFSPFLDLGVGTDFWLSSNMALELGLSLRYLTDPGVLLLSPSIGGAFTLTKGK